MLCIHHKNVNKHVFDLSKTFGSFDYDKTQLLHACLQVKVEYTLHVEFWRKNNTNKSKINVEINTKLLLCVRVCVEKYIMYNLYLKMFLYFYTCLKRQLYIFAGCAIIICHFRILLLGSEIQFIMFLLVLVGFWKNNTNTNKMKIESKMKLFLCVRGKIYLHANYIFLLGVPPLFVTHLPFLHFSTCAWNPH